MEVILSKVLKKIEPRLHEVYEAHRVFTQVKDIIRKKWPELEVKLMGSVAKDTFLSSDKDLDIFVLFDPRTERKELERTGLLVGKTVFEELGGKYEVSYAEHPYTQGTVGKYEIEIVPAYRIKHTRNLISAVDRTPFHTRYVQQNLHAPGEVRLLKKFLKGIGCYGSDLKTEGYSGYLCELLIIKYGTFPNTLKAMQNWRFQEIIDIGNHHPKKKYDKLKGLFEAQPLIFIDPTDKMRNVAAVLSKEKLAVSIYAAALFMKKPTTTFFFPKKRSVDRKKALELAKKRGAHIVVLMFGRPEVIEDILYPQLRRFLNLIAGKLAKEGYEILRASVFGDANCGLAFEVDEVTLPETRKKRGPSIFNSLNHRMRFLEHNKNVWVEDDRLISEEKRKHLKIEAFLFDLLKKPLSKLTYEGVPSHLAKEVYRGFDVLVDSKLSRIKSDEFWRWVERKAF